jgi:hypothetical protein
MSYHSQIITVFGHLFMYSAFNPDLLTYSVTLFLPPQIATCFVQTFVTQKLVQVHLQSTPILSSTFLDSFLPFEQFFQTHCGFDIYKAGDAFFCRSVAANDLTRSLPEQSDPFIVSVPLSELPPNLRIVSEVFDQQGVVVSIIIKFATVVPTQAAPQSSGWDQIILKASAPGPKPTSTTLSSPLAVNHLFTNLSPHAHGPIALSASSSPFTSSSSLYPNAFAAVGGQPNGSPFSSGVSTSASLPAASPGLCCTCFASALHF